MGLAASSDINNLPAVCEMQKTVSILGLGRSPGERLPTPGFLPGEFQGQRSLVGYSKCFNRILIVVLGNTDEG